MASRIYYCGKCFEDILIGHSTPSISLGFEHIDKTNEFFDWVMANPNHPVYVESIHGTAEQYLKYNIDNIATRYMMDSDKYNWSETNGRVIELYHGKGEGGSLNSKDGVMRGKEFYKIKTEIEKFKRKDKLENILKE